jgi:dTDP-4-dehydrorhamnose 3,5-epimerase
MTIDGVVFGAVHRIDDERGSFGEIWRASAYGPAAPPFVQGNLSTSRRGVLRGLHVHRRQLDHWVVIDGRAFVALVDIRPLLATDATATTAAERPAVVTRELGPGDWVDVPAGVAHGFLALQPLTLLYLVTNEYDGSDESGFAWDDPRAAVPWPEVPDTVDGRPILSERDRSNASLDALVVLLRDSGS